MTQCTCGTCGKSYDDYYVWEEVWNATWLPDELATDADSYLCLDCLELDLGRRLTASDFTGNPANAAYIRHCDKCDALFRPNIANQWYCSVDCGNSEKWVIKETCAECGTRFRPIRSGQRYCSRECGYSARQAPLLFKECICGKRFDTFNPRQKYCSLQCSAYAKKEAAKVNHPETDCACGCGRRFTPKRKDQRFSTRACAVRYARMHKTLHAKPTIDILVSP